MDNKEQIIKKNEKISEAIFICQMMEHPGFTVLSNFLEEKEKEIRYQDIFGLKPENLQYQQGIAAMIEDIKTYFKQSKTLSLVPKTDPETGEEEILNNKK